MIWQGTDIAYNQNELDNLAYYSALACNYLNTPEDLHNRRELFYHYLSYEFRTTRTTDTINRYRKILPIKNNVKRVLNNKCVAYNNAPVRTCSIDDLKKLIENSRLNVFMKNAYKAASFIGIVAVRPLFINGELQYKIYYPNEFRVILATSDALEPDAIIYIDKDLNGKSLFRYWDANEYYTIDSRGHIVEDPKKNDYGVIPFAFLRLENSKTFWTAGNFELVEENLKINKNRFLADINATFNSSPIKIGTNIGTENIDMSPDKIIIHDDVAQGDGQLLPPSIEFVNPMPQYDVIFEYSNSIERNLFASLGFPASMINVDSSTTLSGISREIERIELIEARNADIEFLSKFEKDLAKLIAIISNIDDLTNFPLEFSFSIDYAEERIYQEPEVEFQNDKTKMMEYVLDPLEFFKKWGGLDKNIEENEAIELIAKRKELLEKLGLKQAAVINGENPQIADNINNNLGDGTNGVQSNSKD